MAPPPAAVHRPAFHYWPQAGWMNDPNGLVYANGEYHLFYQFHPGSTVWGPMHWGHATSRDLVHWRDRPIALHPQGDHYVFSGSAVVDVSGDAGVGAGALIAIYTDHDAAPQAAGTRDCESQHLAYSTDDGLTWRRHPANPVMRNRGESADFRDPKVFWHARSARWIAALAAGDRIQFWGSPNLTDWDMLGEFGVHLGSHEGVWECPDLFELAAPGQGDTASAWVLLVSVTAGAPNGGSGTQYFVGQFDGHRFLLEDGFAATLARQGAVWLDQGRDNYAGVTWSGEPAGRRVLIGWMSNWHYARDVPATSWRGAMTTPIELGLVRTPGGPRLRAWPVAEIDRQRAAPRRLAPTMMSAPIELTDADGAPPSPGDVEVEFELPADAATIVGIELGNALGEVYRVGFDGGRGAYFSDRTRAGDSGFSPRFAATVHHASRAAPHATVAMRLLLDLGSAELFADRGEVLMTDTFFPTAAFSSVRLFCEGGPARLLGACVHALRPAPVERREPGPLNPRPTP